MAMKSILNLGQKGFKSIDEIIKSAGSKFAGKGKKVIDLKAKSKKKQVSKRAENLAKKKARSTKKPISKKEYEKTLPDTLKKRIDKLPVTTTPKKIKKIDIANIMKNPRTGRGQKLPVRTTDKNKTTGTNITKRVIEGEVLQGVKPPKGGGVRKTRTIEGQFKRLTPQAIRNQMKNTRTGRGQDKLNIQGLKRKQILGTDKDFPGIKPQQAPAKEENKKVKPPKDFSPKIKKTPTPSVKREDLPKTKSNDYTGRFIDKEGNVAYDSFSDFIAHMTGKPKKRKMPKKTYRPIGEGNKLKRKKADVKGAGKGVKFQAFKEGTKDKTVGLKPLPPKSKNPGIHKLPAKTKINMGFKPMFGGGFISSLYDKPEKTEKYKGNTTSARQVKGYGKAKKKA